MKIVILNGNPEPSPLDAYLDELRIALLDRNEKVELIELRNLGLKYCTGCFDCWTKTPGMCVADQASQEMDRLVINSDFVLWAAPFKMGFPSALLKMALDKHLPLIHPYMVVVQGEAHHLKRYESYPRVGLLVEEEADTTPQELEIIQDIFARTALNFKTRLEFRETTTANPADLAQLITTPQNGGHLYRKGLKPIPGERIDPPPSLTVFNGSPRGKKGNTPIMLGEFLKGFGGEGEMHHLVFSKDLENQVRAFQEADCVWLGFPLYTDAMPGIVKTFLEALAPLQGKKNNPPLGFLVQSGFPEGLHSRYVERYLANMAARLGSPYLGTIVKGGGEGTRIMPPNMNRRLFEWLQALGRGFAEEGRLDGEILKALAKPERYPTILGPIFRIFLRSKMAHRYFDNMLVDNQAFEQRNARPFEIIGKNTRL